MRTSSPFLLSTQRPWESVGLGIRRQVLTYDDRLMVVKVAFERGGIGSRHRHLHTQMTYVESGVFTVCVGDEKKVLVAGDSFHIPSDVWHGVECIEAGVLLDVFSPARTDFL
ncbi:cupin domain-containing protein [Hymenobacter saemangeumensis]|uniref:Cupin domain-containing protein n=1 Tax=Hymenobacter saemangeumensis TaxID=1084522 RepID=A0ABP8I7Y2_9BACT